MSTARRSAFALLALLLFVGGMLPWFVADDVCREVAEQRPVLLGRYALAGFAWRAFVITPACWLLALFCWARRTRSHRYVLFRIAAIGFAVLVALVVTDVTGRALRSPAPLEDTTVEVDEWPTRRMDGRPPTRPPRVRYEVHVEDVRPAARSYPDAPPGQPPTDVVLTTDARGHRNRQALEAAGVVTIGGAFTEGVGVDDAACWPARLAAAIGEPVYNLGLAGASTAAQLEALVHTGLALEPKVVIIMVSEAEDFAPLARLPADIELVEPVAPRAGGLPEHIGQHVTTSPVTRGIRRALLSWCGPVRANEALPAWAPLDWMPLRVRAGPRTKAYAFTATALHRHAVPEKTLERSHGFTHLRAVLETMARRCGEKGVRLIVSLAPSKPHVVLPLVEDAIPVEGLHRFASYAASAPLAEPEVYRRALFERLDARERLLDRWCRLRGLSFVRVTEALRARVGAGDRIYFTYHPYWTSDGHAVVARRMLDALQR